MSHQIKITVHDDLYQVIKDYADNHDCSLAFAATQIAAVGAETLEGRHVRGTPNDWGGVREGAGRPSRPKAKTEEDYHSLAAERGIKWISHKLPKNVGTNTAWECPEGHTWLAPYKNIYTGSSCPHCVGLAPKSGSDYNALADERGFKWTGRKAPRNTETLTVWECPEGHRWDATYHNIKLGNGCPHCYNLRRGQNNRSQ